jgi:putative membrane protein
MSGPNVALIVHLLGLLLWIGGATTAAWMAAALVAAGDTKALSSVRSALLAIVAPGILLATIGGLARLIPVWSAHYAHAPWMHAKLAIGFVLGALHGVLVARVRKAATGAKPGTPGLFVAIAVAYTVLGLAAVALAILRPGE